MRPGQKFEKRNGAEYFKRLCDPIRKSLHTAGYKFTIDRRAQKDFIELSKQTIFSEVDYAMDIVLDTTEVKDCFRVFGLVMRIFVPIPDCFENYISEPRENGYECLHTVLIGPEGKYVGLRIGTKEMFASNPE